MDIRELEDEATGAGRCGLRILITGEGGVGKQTLARSIHELSCGATAPLIAVDCSEVSDCVFESEWLNAAPGGWLDLARGGSIFIRSIEKMSPRKQSSMFRYLDAACSRSESGGDAVSQSQRVRLIAAGCSSLFNAVEAGRFREDLFYRLNSVHFPVPPLRERRQEIPSFVDRFLCAGAEVQRRPAPVVRADAMRCLVTYAWPGNIRQLKALSEYLLTTGAETIDTRMLPSRILFDALGEVRGGLAAVPVRASTSARSHRAAWSR